MTTTINEAIYNQFLAAMCTLNQIVDNCSNDDWSCEHFDGPVSQVIFHTLIFTDIYLGRSENAIKDQEFHITNKDAFRDYEELEDKIPQYTYEKEFIKQYLEFCIEKGKAEIFKENIDSFYGNSGFSFRKFSRLELYIYLIRHIQHHAAQLGLRMQEKIGKELKWIGSGWKEV